jgi:hypothetical protein
VPTLGPGWSTRPQPSPRAAPSENHEFATSIVVNLWKFDVLPTAEAGGFQPVHAAGAGWGWSSNTSRFPAGSCFGDRSRPGG